MLIRVPQVLDAEQVRDVRRRLDAAGDAWVDGRVTAGHQGAQVKHNLQIAEDAPIARELGAIVLSMLERHPLFLSAALPADIYPPMFNRYESASGMQFGRHVDGAVRLLPGTGIKLRTDISATLFSRRRTTTTVASCTWKTRMGRTASSSLRATSCSTRRRAPIAYRR